ncbi:methyltransferase domain-containing protein [Spirosoma sp. HMF4905]|uniref:Methyltransferase domain-containing protein n=1 Tax=Spirosoma arboris TaxID=2682092 RepID=A0A7K1S5W7_9BACT|nr:class I SAM-dependent methyltransferase [Spirosoma arboris]MVM29046.1 methyltransferase domain-containing protein [Spirosoma arboris]
MKSKVELYSGTYKNYADEVYANIRVQTYGEDIGQNSWITAEEYRHFFAVLGLAPNENVLELATGSGGPAVFMVKETGVNLVGIDSNENGVANATRLATENALNDKLNFRLGDASEPLPFEDECFDVVMTIDSINHFKNRGKVLAEIKRVLKPGGRLLYTDPVVVTGIVTNEELAIRSSIGYFLFVPVGENEKLLSEAGFTHIQCEDVTENIATTSKNWFDARENWKDELLKIETEDTFHGLQAFARVVHLLTSEKRLSRFMFTAIK